MSLVFCLGFILLRLPYAVQHSECIPVFVDLILFEVAWPFSKPLQVEMPELQMPGEKQ